MPMPFTFTFSQALSGISNPFSTTTNTTTDDTSFPPVPHPPPNRSLLERRRRGPPRPSGSPIKALLPRKRTRSELPETEDAPDDDSDSDIETAHRSKRLRSIPVAIYRTAVSALVFGGAAGLTVFHLLRDGRRKTKRSEEQLRTPPPPYHLGEWQPPEEHPDEPHDQQQGDPQQSNNVNSNGWTPQRGRNLRTRQSYPVRRSLGTHRRAGPVQKRRHGLHKTVQQNISSPFFPPTQSEFDFEADPEDLDKHMDQVGGRVSLMIQEGRKALGQPIVVKSEVKEDEEDDSMPGVWKEEGDSMDDDGEGAMDSNRRASSASDRRSSIGSSSHSRIPRLSSHRKGSSLGGTSNIIGAGAEMTPGSVPSSPAKSQPYRKYNGNGIVNMPGGTYNGGLYTPPQSAFGGSFPSPSMMGSSGISNMTRGMGEMGVRGGDSFGTATPTNGSYRSRLINTSVKEDPNEWQSLELKESMQRAREKVMAMRSGRVSGDGM